MANRRSVLLAGLDIGTSKTAVVAAMAVNGVSRMLGAATFPSVGLQKGSITDVDSAAKAIKQALEKAEKVAGAKIVPVYVGFNGISVSLRDCRTDCASFTECIPQDEKVLQFIHSRYATGGHNLFNGTGKRVITAGVNDIANILESARLAGLSVRDVIYSPLAGARVLLSPAEMELGIVLVEIGAATTTVSIFDRGSIRETAVLAIGGEHLAGDLAIGLRTSMGKAEEILKKVSLEEGTTWTPGLTVADGMGNDERRIGSIIGARVVEILDLIAETVSGFDYPGLLPGGVVFYGGVSQLAGLVCLAESRLQRPVRAGMPGINGAPLSLSYVNAYGLVKHGLRYTYRTKRRKNSSMGNFSRWPWKNRG